MREQKANSVINLKIELCRKIEEIKKPSHIEEYEKILNDTESLINKRKRRSVMYNALSQAQEQRITNMAKCMRANDIQSIHFIDNDKVNYYLTGIDTLMLDVEIVKEDGVTHTDSYIISKDNCIKNK